MNKEYIELQNLIDAIITTAKLLGYQVHIENNLIGIKKHDQWSHFLILSLCEKTSKLSIMQHGTYLALENDSYQTKIDHLREILQRL